MFIKNAFNIFKGQNVGISINYKRQKSFHMSHKVLKMLCMYNIIKYVTSIKITIRNGWKRKVTKNDTKYDTCIMYNSLYSRETF